MNEVTIEEAKKMIGTEFVYVTNDGATVPAYIKKFDPEIGLTALSLDTKLSDGYCPRAEELKTESDGTFCILGINFSIPGHRNLHDVLSLLHEIKTTGKYKSRKTLEVLDFSPSCAFGE